jgi:hypothetical protein
MTVVRAIPAAVEVLTGRHVHHRPVGVVQADRALRRATTRTWHVTWASTLGIRALPPRLPALGPVVRLAGSGRDRRLGAASARAPAMAPGSDPGVGCQKSAWPVNCGDGLGQVCGMMVDRVPAPALSHLRPALRLAGPARPGPRPPRTLSCSCCGTRSPCCAGPVRGPAGPGRPGSPRRADPAPAPGATPFIAVFGARKQEMRSRRRVRSGTTLAVQGRRARYAPERARCSVSAGMVAAVRPGRSR